ncbi:hypothetical protein SAMD00023353_0500590 [Rosellinia necatrix]|uniref:Heterokaryon incompatibility domain-containing protein n=1 Tax=Rosellinia necatrix TaxID=77044 RepID=A0A1S7UK79_ROSNE|nr:hypothetical protein SAMD00023353_0500590 [Rosellinia necatrix]
MCKSKGWVGQVLSKPVVTFTEDDYEIRCWKYNTPGQSVAECFSDISLDTNLLLPSRLDLTRVHEYCENDVQGETLGLKLFSDIRNPQGPFLKLIDSVHHTWDQYTAQPGWTRRTSGFREYPQCLGQEILAYVFVISKVTQLRECRDSICEQRRIALDKAVPRCGWPALEALAVRALACWLPNFIQLILSVLLDLIPEDGRAILRDGFKADKRGHRHTVSEVEELPRVVCLNVDGVADLCRWVFRIAYGGNWSDEPRLRGQQTQAYNQLEGLLSRLGSYYETSALLATQQCRLRGPCPNRLWNVSMLGVGGVADLPSIAAVALRSEIGVGDQENPHLDCTEQSCLFSHKNSTLVPQHHACASEDCGPVAVFPKNVLNAALGSPGPVAEGRPKGRPWAPSAWRIGGGKPSLCVIGQRYMAISHVWADGTGERSRDSGEVNTCLMNYFSKIAHRLNCCGIWWDAISVPTGPLRAAAIDNMLVNYENAAATLVHDRELVDFEWRNDGSPAVAVILSSWFTRGWTAAELWASRKHPVKILFKDPDKTKTEPLIKDLDEDILAWDPKSMRSVNLDDLAALDAFGRIRGDFLLNREGLVPSYGHFVATDILRRLRDGGASGITTTSNLRDLLLNLRARVTSWVKDLFIIPGLMCLESIDSNSTGPQITRDILSHFGTILCSDLFHGEVPINPSGAWSWCPPSIFDLGVSQNSLSRRPISKCTLVKEGLLLGDFTAYTLKRDDVVVPFGRHPAVSSRISEALRDKWSCLLLTDPDDRDQSHRQYILTYPVWVGWVGRTLAISCHWAGCVYLGIPNAIDPYKPSKAALDKPFVTAKELGYSNMRLRLRGTGSVKFLFGADADEKNCLLPPMRPTAVSSALSSFARATIDRRGSCKWVIGMQTEKSGKVEWERRPQPVCVYPPNTTERLDDHERDIHPSFHAIIDESRDHNALDPLIVSKLPFYTKEESVLQRCEISHRDCKGIIHLAWSFPHAPVTDGPILRRIFRSPFHVMETGWTDTDMRIGWLTYSKHIATRCVRARGDGVEKNRDVQVITSSIREISAEILDWNKPLQEDELLHERRPRKYTSHGNLGDAIKGPTFDSLFKDIGLQ